MDLIIKATDSPTASLDCDGNMILKTDQDSVTISLAVLGAAIGSLIAASRAPAPQDPPVKYIPETDLHGNIDPGDPANQAAPAGAFGPDAGML